MRNRRVRIWFWTGVVGKVRGANIKIDLVANTVIRDHK